METIKGSLYVTFTKKFIEQTAKDYDIEVAEVECKAKLCTSVLDFYNKLETILLERRMN